VDAHRPARLLCHHARRPAIITLVALECVLLTRLPGRAVALVSAEVATIGEQMGEMRRLDLPRDEDRQSLRCAPRKPQNVTQVLGELG
jgi:hypothetical protein